MEDPQIMKRIAILGSTGSIGVQTLDVIAAFPERYSAYSLTVNTRIDLLEKQIAQFNPHIVTVMDPDQASQLSLSLDSPQVLTGLDGLIEAVTHPDIDMVISALPGSIGLIPTLKAIEANKTIGLANKEILVMAGEILIQSARFHNVNILPIDSEHCAIHQCLSGQDPSQGKRLILTASGGPFQNIKQEDLETISSIDALNHPTWNMGPKVTIDSATLMNKGFEVIEAHWLFEIPISKIEVVIHPQSIIHSMIEMVDGSILAQLGPTDMRIPIQYVLSYPERLDSPWPRFDIGKHWSLTLDPPDMQMFPCLGLAYQASRMGNTLPTILSTADEIAVESFLQNQIGFTDIPLIINDALEDYTMLKDRSKKVTLESIMEADLWTRTYCRQKLFAR